MSPARFEEDHDGDHQIEYRRIPDSSREKRSWFFTPPRRRGKGGVTHNGSHRRKDKRNYL